MPETNAPETSVDETEVSSQGLARAGWLIATVACLVAAAVAMIRGDHGYAAVGFAVAIAAAINLL